MGKTGIRSGLARLGLAAAPLEPHEFESSMHMLFAPAAPSMASVPNVVTPVTSARCARAGCDRPRADPSHRLGHAEPAGPAPDGTGARTP
jgi:hypothetical protein